MIKLNMHTQPDDESCGPTSLHAVYEHYGVHIPLPQLSLEIERSMSGGTLASLLGKHALNHGFNTQVHVNNVAIFDPTWFVHGKAAPDALKSKLKEQLKYKKDKAIMQVTEGYLAYLDLGGQIIFGNTSSSLLKEYFYKNIPILAGLSATYLYQCPRERYINGVAVYDDIRGLPCGHFVVLCGYDEANHLVVVADPQRENPISHNNYYKVGINKLISAIMLGVLTYDATLLIIQPK